MKTLKLIGTALAIALTSTYFTSCKYDDQELWDNYNRLEERVTQLEILCQQNNENIASLQTIVDVLESGDYITDIIPITNDNKEIGYKITFAKAGTITIYHGQNGTDGKDGENGKDGKDGHTPVIGVKQDSDGVYYWTIDGEFIVVDGQKMYVQGKDGKDGEDGKDGADGKNGANGKDGEDGKDGTDGVDGSNGKNGKDGLTPQFKIENGYWYISYNGVNWTSVGKATGDDGADSSCIFTNVTSDDKYVYFTLADGTVIKVEKGQ